MIKIAVISDIHGNKLSLEEVLKDAKNQGCTKIFCLGDVTLAGPQPLETTDFVMQQDWTIIQGNTDMYIGNYSEKVFALIQEKFPVMANAMADDVNILKEKHLNWLKSLPASLEITVEGVKIMLVHGSVRANDENIYPNMSIEKIEEMLAGTDADLILCGHTHIPCGYQTRNNQTLINVGSVGRPMTEDAIPCYAVISVNGEEFSAEHRFVKYDNKKAAKMLMNRGFEGAESLSKLLISPNSRHV